MNKRIEFLIKKNLKEHLVLTGVNYPLKLNLIKEFTENKKVLFVVENEQKALSYKKDLETLFGLSSEFLPAQEAKFYEDVPHNPYILSTQIKSFLSNSNLVIANHKVLFEKFPTKDFYIKNSIKISKNQNLDYTHIAEKLIKLGYRGTSRVSDIGEFSLRGDILDVYTHEINPIRIEFFADTIESIRTFDVSTQKSIKHIENIEITPLYKFILNENSKENLKKEITKNKDYDWSEIIEKIENQGYFDGIEYYGEYFTQNSGSILENFKDYLLIFDDYTMISEDIKRYSEILNTEYKESKNSPLKFPLSQKNHNQSEEIFEKISHFTRFSFDSFVTNLETLDFESSLPPDFNSSIELFADYIRNNKNKAEITLSSAYKQRLIEILKEFEIPVNTVRFAGLISQGGEFEFENKKQIYLTDKEIFNKRKKQTFFAKYSKNKQSIDFIESVNDIKEGDYVVHAIHGIGLFAGISKIETEGYLKDYLTILFQGADKLYMPAEQINLLHRYRGEGSLRPALSKMGGSAWSKIKSKVKQNVEIVAQDLIDLYAKRKMSKGIAFETDSPWQVEMEDAFEWVETPDQMKAIEDVKADMELDYPMDRLICADVGYGKTEVALRAIFKCVMSGHQALMLSPTTILTHQHALTLQERFAPFSIRVEELSRFKSKKEQSQIVKDLEEGKVDVVIGTHRILQKDIKPKKLGLLVIDEEHKFGVRHKEKIKEYKANIDVLSLSATPIPRTLNMALSGIKNMSIINTPPKNRLPIRTYVGFENTKYIKNAIDFEISRGGQVFFLHNRIDSIYTVKKNLEELMPNIRIAVAHGQMPEGQLEEIFSDFAIKNFDVLLCTTIIESGLDLPNVNTIIIDDADRLGLAQLYQLRGRVGRSERQAFCYCFVKNNKVLNEDAQKRLNAIKDFTSLGSGYQIALRDIEIRGVGNILGSKQHGHMASVGFDTYCELLEEAVSEIKAHKEGKIYKKAQEPAIIDINADAYIPDNWVGSYDQKMLEYKKLSDVKSLSELEDAEISLKDRFSKLPDSVCNLIKLIKLRLLATNLSFSRIQETQENIRIYTPYSLGEWNILRRKLKPEIFSLITYKTPPKLTDGTKGILIVNKRYFDFDKIFNILSDLMYDISRIIVNDEQ